MKIKSIFYHHANTIQKGKLLISFALFAIGISLAVFAHVALSAPGDIVFRGNAWSAYMQEGVTRGVGWVVFSSEGTGSAVPIKVYADDTGKLHGGAWASIQDPSNPSAENYGWLAFDGIGDTCPQGNAGLCEPKLNKGLGEISGWARFVNVATSTPGYWDGWVKLRNSPTESVKYGVCFGNSKQKAISVDGVEYFTGEECMKDGDDSAAILTGMMWGGEHIGGWFVFTEGAPSGLLTITPSWPLKLAIFEKADYLANHGVTWSVGLSASNTTVGGSASLGTVLPTATLVGEKTVYSAPNSGKNVFVVAENQGGNRASVQVETTAPYRLNTCIASGMTLSIDWSGLYGSRSDIGEYPTYASHSVKLYGKGVSKTASAPATNTFDLLATKTPGNDSFLHKNLSTSTKYYYQLRVDYATPETFSTSTPVLGPCVLGIVDPVSDSPSRTKAFAIDTNKILVNWKDNTTTTSAYKFEIQRIKLTPASSTKLVATSTKAEYVKLAWSNITTSTPFYHELERSTSTNVWVRFNQNPRAGALDPSFNEQDVDGWNRTYLMTNPQDGNVIFSDTSVNEATTYYYRTRACSTIDPQNAYNTDLERGLTEKPNPVCGKYASVLGPGSINDTTISTTTLPYAPTQATSTASWDGSTHSIVLRWADNSKRETGYRIKRDGVEIAMVAPSAPGATITLTYTDTGTNNATGPKTALAAGTYYDYEIQAYYDFSENEGGRMYSDKATTGTYTYFRVTVGVSPSESGSVGAPGGSSCSNSCTYYYPWGTSVGFTAAETVSGYDWDGWSGFPCNGSTQYTCAFTGTLGNPSITANFQIQTFYLSAGVTGSGRITGSGISCPTDCGETIDYGTYVSLSATPIASSTFLGWSGACNGTSTCAFTMYGNESVSASFTIAGGMQKIKNLFANIFDGAENLFGKLFEKRARASERIGTASILETFKFGIKNVSDSVMYLVRGFSDEFTKVAEHVEKTTEQYIAQHTTVAEGRQYAVGNLEAYYATFNASSTMPSYIDKNLEPDTVYMYRVRATYIGEAISNTAWDRSAATKTLSNTGGPSTTNHGICVQNSYCDFSIRGYKSTTDSTRIPAVEESEEQCTTNSQCRDVGRGGQSYQER